MTWRAQRRLMHACPYGCAGQGAWYTRGSTGGGTLTSHIVTFKRVSRSIVDLMPGLLTAYIHTAGAVRAGRANLTGVAPRTPPPVPGVPPRAVRCMHSTPIGEAR